MKRRSIQFVKQTSWIASILVIATSFHSIAIGRDAPADDNRLVIVTAEEYRSEVARFRSPDDALNAATNRAVTNPNGPSIMIGAPVLDGSALRSPIRIEISWQAQDDASVDVDSFRIRYVIGFLSKDLTGRMLKAVTELPGSRLDKTGLIVPSAELPAGKHKLVIELADSLKRKTLRTLVFQVNDA